MKIYTKIGDGGETMTYGGIKVPKDSWIVDINGDIDALQAGLDTAKINIDDERLKGIINYINLKLWQLGGEVSLGGIGKNINNPIIDEDLELIESYIDSFGEMPNHFVRFNKKGSVYLNEARVRCRVLERNLTQLLRAGFVREAVYKYINRLSDLLFMMSYYLEKN